MRAILFSNFPKDVYENSLKPKFDQHGVDILKVVRPDRTESVDCSQADLLIYLIELMSGGQREKVKTLGRRYNKRVFALYRKGASWEHLVEFMGKMREEEERRKQPPPSRQNVVPFRQDPPSSMRFQTLPEPEPSEPETPELSMEEVKELLKMFEDENEKLEDQKDELIERLKKSDELASGLEKQVERLGTINMRLEGRVADLEKQVASARNDDQYYNALVEQNDALRKELDTARAETEKKSDEIYELKTELAKAEKTVQVMPSKDNPLEQALEPFKQLWKLGFMEPEEILKKLFKEK